ncbi:hypothetical protein [Streptomyces sp. NPDC017940]|uniref:hypothetical protein n=1 Tax=Streptomyces sp. NPDC017940 TaxID=3365017 RepID=UPI00379B268F
MSHRSRRFLATGAVLAAATSAVVTGAPTAQAATVTHCPTSKSTALLPTGQGYFFPNLTVSAAACGFVDNGAPYRFTIGTATSNVIVGGGQVRTHTVENLTTECTQVQGTTTLFASGCHAP